MSNIDNKGGNNSKIDLIKKVLSKVADMSKDGKNMWIVSGAALLIVVLIVGGIIIKPSENNRSHNSETVGEVISVETEATGESSAESNNELLVDAFSKINRLMETYFKAKLDCDTETLQKIVYNTENITEEKLLKENEYIEDYQNIKCYTKNGILDNTYIVYVYFEYKFYNIDTNAPAMIRMYVCTNEAGDVYIYNEAVDGEIASYMEEVNNSDDVVALFEETDNLLKTAIESDENLMGFYTKLIEGVGSETEASTEAETTEASTEEVTTEEVTTEEATTEEVTTEATTEAETTEAATEDSSDRMKNTDDTAYVKTDAKVYSEPVADSELKVASVSMGERYRRIAYNDKWSKIEYEEDVFGFVSNENLIIDEDFIYVNETVYAKQTVRVRAEASYDAEVVGTLYEGESLKRLGYNEEWSKVVFEGDIYFIGKGFLTTNKPED